MYERYHVSVLLHLPLLLPPLSSLLFPIHIGAFIKNRDQKERQMALRNVLAFGTPSEIQNFLDGVIEPEERPDYIQVSSSRSSSSSSRRRRRKEEVVVVRIQDVSRRGESTLVLKANGRSSSCPDYYYYYYYYYYHYYSLSNSSSSSIVTLHILPLFATIL